MAATRISIAVLLTTLAVAPAAADVIFFSNLGPGDSYDQSGATFFGFDRGQEGDPDSRFARAMPFVPGATGTLGAIELPILFPFSFHDGNLVVNLFAASDGLPGESLETFTRTEPYDDKRPLAFRSDAKPQLQSGSTYFIEATTTGEADGIWFLSSLEQSGPVRDVHRFDNGPWQTGTREFTAAFRVTGDAAPIPEPTSMLLLGVGLAAAGVRGWRVRVGLLRAPTRPSRGARKSAGSKRTRPTV